MSRPGNLEEVAAWIRAAWPAPAALAHPALISDADFRTAQQVSAAATPHDDRPRVYALTGLLICQTCGRRLQPHWVHGHPGYRCRHGHTSAHHIDDRPRWVYWPERRILAQATAQLTGAAAFPASGTATHLARYLRGRDAVIICAAAALTIDELTEPDPATTPVTINRAAAARDGHTGAITAIQQHEPRRPPSMPTAVNARPVRSAAAARPKQRTPPPLSRNVNSFGGV